MKFTDLCIRRPVLSTVLSLVVVILGIVTFTRLQVRQYPNIDDPVVSIRTELPGASPEIVESTVTKPLEDSLSGIEGLHSMVSDSLSGESTITITFSLNRDIEAAANDVRDCVSRAKGGNKLPHDIRDPEITKARADAKPFMYVALSSSRHDPKALADYAKRILENPFKAVSGIASVDIYGGKEFQMQIYLNPIKMASYNVISDDIVSAIREQNIEHPGGRIIEKDRHIGVTIKASLMTEKQFNDLIIRKNKDGYLVRLSDVGEAKFDSIDTDDRVRFNDEKAVAILLKKNSVANPVEVAKAVRKKLAVLEEALPKGMKLEVARDDTIFIQHSIDAVYKTLIEATILVVLVILAFLRSFRAVLIPIVTIPVSLIGTFCLMYTLGYSINILTLLALVLAIGLVVDDAIIVLENIYRHIEEGMKPMAAAFKGAQEIGFAVIAMTITLAAVYAPVALSPGKTGRLFTEFAITLAGAVLISGFVALTLSPMMCARLLLPHKKSSVVRKEGGWHGKWDRFILLTDRGLEAVDTAYATWLSRLLKKRWIILVSGLTLAGIGYGVLRTLPSELMPSEDQGAVNVRAFPPSGASLDFIDRYVEEADALMRAVPEMATRLTLVHASQESQILGVLMPWDKRKRTSQQIVDSLREPMQEITGLGVTPYVGGKSLGSGRSESQIEVVLQTSKSRQELTEAGDRFSIALNRVHSIQDPYIHSAEPAQELVVTVDRNKAASLNVDVENIALTLERLMTGRLMPTKVKRENKEYEIKLWLGEEFRKTPNDISSIFVRKNKAADRNEAEELVPLSEVVDFNYRLAPGSVEHLDTMRSLTFTAQLKKGESMGATLQQLTELGHEVLPEGVRLTFSGDSRRFLDEGSNMILIFGLALAFIFLVLAAQYESYIDPLIILFSVPLSLVGGIFFLKLFGQTMNLYSEIGLLTLIGLITKHGILIVDFANKLKAEGRSRVEAIVEASRLRLRPILMTTLAMVLGAVPLAIATGAGAESRRPIGLVIVGGMLIGTLFTLFVVPAVYTFLSRKNGDQRSEI